MVCPHPIGKAVSWYAKRPKEDSINTLEFKDYYVIIPTKPFWNKKNYLRKNKNLKKVKEKFSYNSKDNTLWLNKKNLKSFINAK